MKSRRERVLLGRCRRCCPRSSGGRARSGRRGSGRLRNVATSTTLPPRKRMCASRKRRPMSRQLRNSRRTSCGRRVGADVEVLRGAAQQEVPDASADEIGLVAGSTRAGRAPSARPDRSLPRNRVLAARPDPRRGIGPGRLPARRRSRAHPSEFYPIDRTDVLTFPETLRNNTASFRINQFGGGSET